VRIGAFLLLSLAALPAVVGAQSSNETPPPIPTTPGTGVSTPIDPTRPAPPGPAVTPDAPLSIFVPPPTIPSTSAPVILPSGGGGLPPKATFGFSFGVAAGGEYSDNFNLTSTHRVENFRSVLAPGGVLDINGAFTKGSIRYTLAATHDTSGDDEINLFHQLAANVAWEASPRLKLTLSEYLTHSDEPTLADRLSLRRERRVYTSNTLGIRSDYRIDQVATSASYQYATFSADSGTSGGGGNTVTHTVGVTAGTSLYATNTLTLGYDYLTSRTDGQTTLGGTSSDMSVSGHQLTGTFQRQVTTSTTVGVTGSIGFRHEDSDGGTSTDFKLWNIAVFNTYTSGNLTLAGSVGYSALRRDTGDDSAFFSVTSISYRFARAVAILGFDSGFSETYSQGENFGVVRTRGVTGTFVYEVTPSLTGSVTGFYRENHNTGAAGSLADERETTWGATLGIGLQLTRWLRLTTLFAHTEATTSGATTSQSLGRDYTENRVRLLLSASF